MLKNSNVSHIVSAHDVETSGTDPVGNSVLSWACVVHDFKKDKSFEFYEECRPEALVPYYEHPTMKNYIKHLWSEEAEKVHGFTWGESTKKQHPMDMCVKFYKFIKPFIKDDEKLPFIYHANAEFDWRFLKALMNKQSDRLYYAFYKVFSENKRHNTMAMARDYIRDNKAQLKLIKESETKINKPRKRAARASDLTKWNSQIEEADSFLNGRVMFNGYSLDKICKSLDIKLEHHNALSDAKALIPIFKFFNNY